MASSSKPAIIQFLDANNILWFPIADMKLDAEGRKDFKNAPHKKILSYQPDPNDFKNLSVTEIKARQKKYTKTNTIAIDTREVAHIDCDNEGLEMQDIIKSFMKGSPYFLSYTKELPHIFVKLEKYLKFALGLNLKRLNC